MGNYKFRLSNMIPNAWFYKLKDMNTVVKKHHKTTKISALNHPHIPKITNQPLLSDQRKSYHFTRDLADNSPIRKTLIDKKFPVQPPRKSSRRRNWSRKNRFVSSPISAGCSCRTSIGEYSNSLSPDQAIDTLEEMLYWSTNCKGSAQKDIVIELDNNSVPELTPIVTKKMPTNVQRSSTEFSVSNQSNLIVKDNVTLSTTARNSSSPGLKLRTNSPRIAIQGGRKSMSSSNSSLGSWRRRNSISERSYAAVVKSSKNPGRDFRESMMEMMVENNIRASKDLEELLASYLSLNSDEYHDLIINVFKQIWFDLIHFN